MSNTELIQSLVVAEGLRVLSNELVFTNKINRAYEDKFNLFVEDHKTGATINIPMPMRTSIRSGWTMQVQNIVETSIPLTISTPKGDDVAFTENELSLLVPDPDKNMPAWSKRFLKPRITRLANAVDADLFARAYVMVANQTGTAGTVPNTYAVIGDSVQKLDDNLAPPSDRYLLQNPAMKNKIADALKGTFVRQVSEPALLKGFIGDLGDLEIYMTQNVPSQTVGNIANSTPLVSGSSQTGSSLVTNGWANSQTVLNQGDIFTLAGVFAVNYVTGSPSSSLAQFVVTAPVVSDSSGNATIQFSTGQGGYSGIITSGPTQSVSNSPASGAAITVTGSANTAYAQNLAFHKDAFTVAFAKLSLPKDMGVKAAQATFDGFTMRYMRGYDIVNAQMLDRIDVYYGMAGLYTQHANRLTA